MRLDKEKLNILINNSGLGYDELIKLKIITPEKILINAGLNKSEFDAYDKYCFEHSIRKSVMTRRLIRYAMKNKDKIKHVKLPLIVKRTNHCFLVDAEMKEKIKGFLEQLNYDGTPMKEAELVRSCIVVFLKEQEEAQ